MEGYRIDDPFDLGEILSFTFSLYQDQRREEEGRQNDDVHCKTD